MIARQAYDNLKTEYGSTSSWAVWSAPENGNWKSKSSVSDMTLFTDEDSLVDQLNGDFIFVGLNPAAHNQNSHSLVPWENFHSADAKRSQDYKLRNALYGTRYWGSFITDVYPEIVETDSAKAMKNVTEAATKESVNNVLEIRNILGGKATIVAIGGKAYAVLKKHLPGDVELKKITHYAAYVNIDDYRSLVLTQLGETGEFPIATEKSSTASFAIDDIRLLYNAFIALCDFVEEGPGCGKCQLYEKLCGAKDQAAVKSFGEALTRIRERAYIPDP